MLTNALVIQSNVSKKITDQFEDFAKKRENHAVRNISFDGANSMRADYTAGYGTTTQFLVENGKACILDKKIFRSKSPTEETNDAGLIDALESAFTTVLPAIEKITHKDLQNSTHEVLISLMVYQVLTTNRSDGTWHMDGSKHHERYNFPVTALFYFWHECTASLSIRTQDNHLVCTIPTATGNSIVFAKSYGQKLCLSES
jgi:hypothetical protein